MGIIDAKWALRNAGDTSEDITMNATTPVLSKSIDTRALSGYAAGRPMFLNVRVKTVGTAAATTVSLHDSADDSTYASVVDVALLVGAIVVNTTIVKIPIPASARRYWKMNIVGGAAATTVVNAWISND